MSLVTQAVKAQLRPQSRQVPVGVSMRHIHLSRREVDALKNLSHTYIPQVYDFVEESGTVYTVMDYIEGESLDRPLARGVPGCDRTQGCAA